MDSTGMLVKIGSYILGFFLIIAALVWLTSVHPAFANSASGTLPPSFSLSSEQFGLEATTTPLDAGTPLPNFDGDGVVFIDMSSGSPGTPYIAYETTKGRIGIKELIFAQPGTPLCQVSAGEFPCAPVTDSGDVQTTNNLSGDDVSPVPSGTPVHLVGGVDSQAIVVQSVQTLPTMPSGMVEFSTPLGDTSTLTNGLALQPSQILTNQSCTLFVGCYGSNTQRVATTLRSGNSNTTTELIPGNLFTYGNSNIILLSVDGSGTTGGSSGTANFLVASFK